MNTGEDLPVGQVGELCVRGYIVMKEYYKKPEETAKVFDKDGWFHTGDLVKMDESGYLTFMGRSKDIIISGGENIDPVEVENFLSRHAKVLKAEVIGVPDRRLNEVVMAFIALKKRDEAQEDEIKAFCKGKIASYKIPKYIRFIDYQNFPTTSFGKVQKFKLREMALKELGLKD
jgi:fatty-acyl-CoA synthase